MSIPSQFQGFVVRKNAEADNPEVHSAICELNADILDGEVLIQVEFSAVNYKDALAANGDPGVARKFPLVPGIDAGGVVVESASSEFSPGDRVIVAHAKFGTAHHGGWAQYARVPSDWVYKVPSSGESTSVNSFSIRDAVTWGTAGFTAAQSVEQIVNHSIKPDAGPVVVSGATGGVGIFAIKLLAKLGYEVYASTGKLDKTDWLMEHGAAKVISRTELNDDSASPLLKGRWAAAIDTVGGNTLATILKTSQLNACVTACGLVGGSDLITSVFPFILRGVTLCGIDSANISRETRQDLWNKIATQWQLEDLSDLSDEITLTELPLAVTQILKGRIAGRTIVTF